MAQRTFFSSPEFVEAVSRSMGVEYFPLAIPVFGSGPPRTMYASASPAAYRSRYVWLAAFGLYASPGWNGELYRKTIERILQFLRGPRTRGFVWTVRFDHSALASALQSVGLASHRAPTHVLQLNQGYARSVCGYSATIRNQIRKAHRRGVSIRSAAGEADVRAYYELHARLVRQKNWRGYQYPVELFLELSRLENSMRLLVAECEGRIVSGAIFFRDGCSVLYWHGASDRAYSHLFASRPVFDEAIRWACETGAEFLNFGGSAGIASLEQFKSCWGARPEMNWTFEWTNPLWARLSALKTRLRGVLG